LLAVPPMLNEEAVPVNPEPEPENDDALTAPLNDKDVAEIAPFTVKRDEGVLVPMPTFPFESMRMRSETPEETKDSAAFVDPVAPTLYKKKMLELSEL